MVALKVLVVVLEGLVVALEDPVAGEQLLAEVEILGQHVLMGLERLDVYVQGKQGQSPKKEPGGGGQRSLDPVQVDSLDQKHAFSA